MSQITSLIRRNVVGLAALFFAVTMGTAYATGHQIGTDDIQDQAVTTPKIGFEAVTTARIAPEAVRGNRIASDAIRTQSILDEAVTRPKVADRAINTAKIAGGAVGTARIADGAVTAAKLADGPYWALAGNAGTDPAADFLGTTDDTPLNFRVNDQRALRIEPHASSPSLIGGHSTNDVTAGVPGATISGGGLSGGPNRVTDDYGTVGGGRNNQAGDGEGTTFNAATATVAGGQFNTASGRHSAVGGGSFSTAGGEYSAVAGGRSHNANGLHSAIGGGWNNTATSQSSTVAGGQTNIASGLISTVAGGAGNTAAGGFSLVGGLRAKNAADHGGVFMFADSSTNVDFNSAAAYEFAVRASGGVRLRTSSNLSTGCNLAAGSGTWDCTSDANEKQGFDAVDGETVLSRLAELPITTWSFKSDGTGARHIGPTAQDFYAAFGLGSDDKTISSVDADGVALAAIKALKKENDEQNELIELQGERIEALERRLNR